ncbi:MAG: rhamnulokinase [Ignavibacteriae bacterium]|nr:rhamnulokinase [Ignavibacteriota bacterium]
MNGRDLLAFDFGASSGRAIRGTFDGSRLSCTTVHQFPNGPVEFQGHLYWDFLRFLVEIEEGIRRAVRSGGGPVSSIGIDTWGVDFGLLDHQGDLLGNPYHYRDRRTEGMFEAACARVPKEEIFRTTGIAFQPFNTLFQLLAMKLQKPMVLDKAGTLLMMPDLLAYALTGERGTEYTDASTSQLLDASARTWSDTIVTAMGFPREIFTPISAPGTVRGTLRGAIAADSGAGPVPVIAVAGHDTASAVVAVPLSGPRSAYLSSGTWSLLGLETATPCVDAASMKANLTNEGGFGNQIRLLRNVMGLWMVQECKREWEAAGDTVSYDELVRKAEQSAGLGSFVDPDAHVFYAPGPMEQRIREFCRSTGQQVPDGQGAIVRCIYESLALKYRWAVEQLEAVTGSRVDELVIVGGGARNLLLNQLTANALKRPVAAGPSEATAIGNLLVQLHALGEAQGLTEMREIVRASFPVTRFEPKEGAAWDGAYERFLRLIK